MFFLINLAFNVSKALLFGTMKPRNNAVWEINCLCLLDLKMSLYNSQSTRIKLKKLWISSLITMTAQIKCNNMVDKHLKIKTRSKMISRISSQILLLINQWIIFMFQTRIKIKGIFPINKQITIIVIPLIKILSSMMIFWILIAPIHNLIIQIITKIPMWIMTTIIII